MAITPNMDNGMSPVHPKTNYKRAYNIYLPRVTFHIDLPNMDNGMSPVHPKTKYKRAYNIYLPGVTFHAGEAFFGTI